MVERAGELEGENEGKGGVVVRRRSSPPARVSLAISLAQSAIKLFPGSAVPYRE
jgi:hypothetical protein